MVQLQRLAEEIKSEALPLSLLLRKYQIYNYWLQWPWWFLSLGQLWSLQKGRNLAISSLFQHAIQAGIGWWGQVLAGLQAAGRTWDQFGWVICWMYWSKQKYVKLDRALYHRQRSVRHYGEMDKIRSKKKINNSSVELQVPTNQAKSLTR